LSPMNTRQVLLAMGTGHLHVYPGKARARIIFYAHLYCRISQLIPVSVLLHRTLEATPRS
jgi:hypothetical protein